MICQDCLMRIWDMYLHVPDDEHLAEHLHLLVLSNALDNLLDFHWVGLPMTWKTCSFGAEKRHSLLTSQKITLAMD